MKINVLRSFFAFRLGIPGQNWSRSGKYFGTADAVWVHGYLRFEPGAWKWNEGLPCSTSDCKILIPLILFKLRHSVLDWTALSWNIAIWRSFIYCHRTAALLWRQRNKLLSYDSGVRNYLFIIMMYGIVFHGIEARNCLLHDRKVCDCLSYGGEVQNCLPCDSKTF